jgi:hypothetical protein
MIIKKQILKTLTFLSLIGILISTQGFSQTKYENTVPETFSTCDVARMISNRVNINRDWNLEISESVNEYILIIEGTIQYKHLGKINLDVFKKSMIKTFPEFYRDILTNSYCRSISDPKLLRIIYYNISGYHLTKEDTEYLEKNFNDETIDKLYVNMREIRGATMPSYYKKLVEEYKILLKNLK